MSLSSRLLAGALLAGAVHAAAACNAVIGIDQATLDTEGQASCAAGEGLTLMTCMAPSDACERCLGGACTQQEVSSCLVNSECRKALANYRTCQRDDCTEPVGGCSGCLMGGTGADCFADCATECQGSEMVSLCQIFCSCMDTSCAGTIDPALCRSNCEASAQPWRTNCLLTHCELAPLDPDHCLHASDAIEACPLAPPTPDPNCTDRRKIGYGCEINDDCCSKLCKEGICSLGT